MLPPGHIAGGFLAAEALLKITRPDLSPVQLNQLLLWGMFFSFAPDLDNFVAFAVVKAWWYKPGTDSSIHRKFLSHVPVLWLIAGVAIYFAAQSEYVKLFGLMIWVGSWTHFLLDSVDYGVMWLWPFNKEVWALRNRGINRPTEENRGFIGYWWNFLKVYTKRWTFYVEIALILISLIIYFH